MSLKPPTSTVINLPEIHKEFGLLVEVDTYAQPLEKRRLLSGDNPFKVWREFFCEQKHEVAEVLGLEDLDYILIEEGEVDADADDIIKFCCHFDIHPVDMTVLSPLDNNVLDALLMVYDNPSLLGKTQSHSKTVSLLREAACEMPFDELKRQCLELKKTNSLTASLVIEFIETALYLDGRMSVRPMDIFDQASVFNEVHSDDVLAEQFKHRKFITQWRAHSKKYNLFGLYLFRDDWSEMNQRLFASMNKNGLDNTMAAYLNDPSFIGRKGFPELTASLFIEKKGWSWRSAQREHWKHAELTYLSSYERNQAKFRSDQLETQVDFFDKWIDENFDFLHAYDNRQLILGNSDFSDMRKDFTPKEMPRNTAVHIPWKRLGLA
jgi:hypothetical protein